MDASNPMGHRPTVTLVFFVHSGKSYIKGKVIDEAIVSFQDIANNADKSAPEFCLSLSKEFSRHPSVKAEDVECFVEYAGRPVRIINFSAVQHGECVYVCCCSKKSFLQSHLNLQHKSTSQPAIHMPPLSELDSSESCEEPKKRKRPNFRT